MLIPKCLKGSYNDVKKNLRFLRNASIERTEIFLSEISLPQNMSEIKEDDIVVLQDGIAERKILNAYFPYILTDMILSEIGFNDEKRSWIKKIILTQPYLLLAGMSDSDFAIISCCSDKQLCRNLVIEIVKKWNIFLESGSVYVNLNLHNGNLVYEGKRPETTFFWKNNHILFKLATRSGVKLYGIDELEKLPDIMHSQFKFQL